MIRIIGGRWRGQKLNIVKLDALRPTGDRVKEMLFNWLAPFIVNSRCLDVFSGTGALGIEALSRGARHVTFIELHRRASQQIVEHLQMLKAVDKAQVICKDALAVLSTDIKVPYDLIFLDPPFAKDCLTEVLQLLMHHGYIHTKTRIYVEQPKAQKNLFLPAHWYVFKEKTLGQVCARLIQMDENFSSAKHT